MARRLQTAGQRGVGSAGAAEGVHRPHHGAVRRVRVYTKESAMKRWWILTLVVGMLALPMVGGGCKGEVDDDGASIKVDD